MKPLLMFLNLLVLASAAVIDQASTTVNVQHGGQEYSYSIRKTHGVEPSPGEVPRDKQEDAKAPNVSREQRDRPGVDRRENLPQLEVVKILQPQLNLVQIPERGQLHVPQEQLKIFEIAERKEGPSRGGEQLVLGIPQEKGFVYPQFVKHHGSGGFFHPLGFYFVPGVVRLV